MNDRSSKISKLLNDAGFRAEYIRAKLDVLIPAQIKALRGDMTQKELGVAADMKQSRISAIETPGATNFNLETLVRLASVFNVGLSVRFVPFSEMLRWENGFSLQGFRVTPLQEDAGFLQPREPSGISISTAVAAGGPGSNQIAAAKKAPQSVEGSITNTRYNALQTAGASAPGAI